MYYLQKIKHTIENMTFNYEKKVGTKGEEQAVKSNYRCCICIDFGGDGIDYENLYGCK